eukprot:1691916-Pyramimonas_sp.AAC.1
MALEAAEAYIANVTPVDDSRRNRDRATPSSSLEERVRNLERVQASHERDIHELQDRICYEVFFKDESSKSQIRNIRQGWRTKDKERKDAHKIALASDKNAELPPHEFGSQ